MNENLILAYRMTVTVLILYFWLNTFLKFHNAMELSTFTLLGISTFVIAIHVKANHPLNAIWILAGLIAVFAFIRIYFRLRKHDHYLFFNLFKANRSSVDGFFQTHRENGMVFSPLFTSLDIPSLVRIDGKSAKELKTFFKQYDDFVKHNLPIRFWNLYLYAVIGLILIAILWRF